MKLARWMMGCGLASGLAAPALAGEEPLYQALPSWVTPAPVIDPVKAGTGAPMVLFDVQQRVEQGQAWVVTDIAMRADTTEALTQLSTITANWTPDHGDLIVHRVQILRGSETIDVLANARFTVLRREQQLERRIILGTLTGTLTVPGLRVGDILRYTVSVTEKDAALAGKSQLVTLLLGPPFNPQFGRVRASWPAESPVRYQVGHLAEPQTAPRRVGAYQVWEQRLPMPKRPDMPGDAPTRYAVPPMLQISDFASWQDLSKTLAPLFAAKGLIKPGGELAREVAAIKAATSDPKDRTARALMLVQSRIAYLLLGMNGGNYVPQPPEKTWETRLGDCKAKTLLLLAMLDELGIAAEPILARSGAGDALPGVLPMAGAFDHVLVHARIGQEDLWLDGTGAGTRKADLADVPPFRHVLPLRGEGADLLALPTRVNARPDLIVDLRLNQAAGAEFASIFEVSATYRGAQAAQLRNLWLQAPPQQRDEATGSIIAPFVSDAHVATSSFTYDEASGLGTLKAMGLADTRWLHERGRQRQKLDLAQISFVPDRARAAWREIPAVLPGPQTQSYRTTIQLPDGGRGITLEGSADVDETIAGAHLRRTGKLDGATYLLTELREMGGAEIAPADIAAQRAKAASIGGRAATLVAPPDTPRAAAYASGPLRSRLQLHDGLYAAIIARNPAATEPLVLRANYRASILDWKGAMADVDRALALEPSVPLHLQRAALQLNLGNRGEAVKSARAAVALEAGNADALIRLATLLGEGGQKQEGFDLLQAQIDNGGNDRFKLIIAKAELLAQNGDAPGALTLLDEAIAARPGDPDLLNARCWAKGTGNLALDTALVDCTKAMQLSESPAPILDSRAMVYFRLGKFEDALGDVDAALQSSPDLVPSQFMRGVILNRLGRRDAGQAQIDLAKRLDPTIAATYGRYGVVP
jgi:tetratricopeptide (TPR) repeat protein/transglutaminase-like putative cysteine protease